MAPRPSNPATQPWGFPTGKTKKIGVQLTPRLDCGGLLRATVKGFDRSDLPFPPNSSSTLTHTLSTSHFLSLNPLLPNLYFFFISSHFYSIFTENLSSSLDPSFSLTNFTLIFFFFFFKLISPSPILHNHLLPSLILILST